MDITSRGIGDSAPYYDSLKAQRALAQGELKENAVIDCGWGRVLMAHTFSDPAELVREMRRETRGRRDIAMYVHQPQVVLSLAPQQLFLDPSDTLRLELASLADAELTPTVQVRRIQSLEDAEAINSIYLKRKMVPTDPGYLMQHRDARDLILLVAEDPTSGEIVGTVLGIDHRTLFNDPTQGSSLWCLAVDPQAPLPGIGDALVRGLAELFRDSGCAYMDLSVMHDNTQAKALYEKFGFVSVRTFAVKNKNSYNEHLFIGPELEENLNPYARIIVDEARSRGISVEVLDAEEGYFRLSRGGKQVTCRESLSELTTAVAMSRCQDKYTTHRWLRKGGFNTPAYREAQGTAADLEFLAEHGQVVVKPAVGEQGRGITVGISDATRLREAIALAKRYCERVIIESFQPGKDLRIVVINDEVVAAAVRKPAEIVGDGTSNAKRLIEKQSRRRQAATGGESRIPIDSETEHCLATAGFALDSVIPYGEKVPVRRTANLHTGGTIHDVTDVLHPKLRQVAEDAARHLDIPVVGFDFIVNNAREPDYVIIEANERVGLANHEPQPTAQRFVDLLFPLSRSARL